jgi:tetratricopeptide (TPR) repeat protein
MKARPMKKLLAVSMMLALAGAAHAGVIPNAAAQLLVNDANVLAAQNKYQEAINKYSEAMKADPSSSVPLSHIAHVLLMVSLKNTPENAAKLKQQAEGAARQALKLGPEDPLAQEVLRTLLDDKPAPLHVPREEVWKLVQEGEVLFQAQKPDEARAKYEQAAQLDPLYSSAWIYAGDCYYVQKNWPEAEARFRKATEIEPLNSQAWRFLSDALAQQGKRPAAEAALLSGIAAQPSQQPNWEKLASLRAAANTPLTPLRLVRKASASLDPATGKSTVNLDSDFSGPDAQKSANGATWLMVAMSEMNIRAKNREDKVADQPFAIELAAWENAMKVVDEIVANGGEDVTDPALKTMRMLAKAGQLETALLLLKYKESWRPEFEAWKKENPNGIRKFIDTYGLRP